MLVLSRRPTEKLVFPSINTTVEVVSLKGGVVRLGIDAPPEVPVYREEVLERQLAEGPRRDDAGTLHLVLHQLNNRLNSSTIGLALLRRQLELGHAADMAGTLDKIEQEFAALRQLVEAKDAPPAKAAAPAPAGRRRALLVEDDVNECELLAGFLRLAGIEVTTASDGADALDHLRQHGNPDVMLLDMLLPRTDGPTTVRAIRGNPAHQGLRIFGVTGADPRRFDLPEGPTGIDQWFRKPLDPKALLSTLSRALDRPA